MQLIWKFGIILLLTLVSMVSVASSAPSNLPANTQSNWPQTLKVGGVVWTLGDRQENEDIMIIEYVTNNESVNNWTQLLTLQKTKSKIRKEVSPQIFAESEISHLKSKPGQEVWHKIDVTNNNEALLEFRISKPIAEHQNELQRIIKTNDDQMILLHYVVKKQDMGDAERSKWTSVLNSLDFNTLQKS